jgi:hypothetical protein
MAFAAEKMSRQILRVTIQHVLYPITESVLHQVFDPYGAVEAIEIFPAKSRIVVFIIYGSHHDAPRAFRSLQGRNIYDGCCQLGIELLPISPSLDATKLKVMTQQAVTKVDAPQQEAEARVHQEPEAAQMHVSTAAASAMRGTMIGQPQAAAKAHKEAAAEAHEEAAPEEGAGATHMQITAARTMGAPKRITAEQPGATAQLVAAVLQRGVTIIEAQKEEKLEATLIREPPTASDAAAAAQPEATPVVALGIIEVALDVTRHGAVGAARPWLSACSLRTSCLSGRGVVLWTVARCLPMRLREGVG